MNNSVPEEWKVDFLENITESITVGHVGSTSEFYRNEGVLFLRTGNLNSGKIVLDDTKFITNEFHERLNKSKLREGDVLVSRVGYTGNAAIVPKGFPEANCANIIIIRSGSGVYPKYLHLFINSPVAAQQNAAFTIGSAQAVLNIGSIKKLKAVVPTYPEQQKIATILSSVDNVIEKTRVQIDKLKDLKTGMMQELLTKGIGHTEFKDSPVGLIPAGWSVVELKDIADVKGGKRMPKGRPFADHVTPYPYIRVTDFRNGTVRTDNLQYVLPEDQKSIKRYIVGKDDLYISIAGTLGLIGSIPDELDGAQLTENAAKIVFHDKNQVSPVFYKHMLLSAVAQEQLSLEKGIGGGVPKLALFRIETITLPFPTFEEQNAISKILDAVDMRIQMVESKTKTIQLAKKALMQDLLTGKVRVNLTDKESAVV